MFPCGKCYNCKIVYKMEWTTRLEHELETSGEGVFVTLTYDDDHLPEGFNIQQNHLQLFLKRFRSYVNYHFGTKLKYYAIGDYGEKTGRPHYHALMFGVGKSCKIFKYTDFEKGHCTCQQWQHGFVHVSTMTTGRIKYVTGYVTKERNSIAMMERIGAEVTPFRIMSNGIGKEYLLKNTETLTKDLCIYKRGVAVKLPRYYRKSLEVKDEEVSKRLKERAYLKQQASHALLKARSQSLEASDVEAQRLKEARQFMKNQEEKAGRSASTL